MYEIHFILDFIYIYVMHAKGTLEIFDTKYKICYSNEIKLSLFYAALIMWHSLKISEYLLTFLNCSTIFQLYFKL